MNEADTKRLITACTDGSSIGESVVDAATWASTRLGAGLDLLHVIERAEPPVGDRSGSLGPGSATQLLDELTELDEKRGKLSIALGKLMLEEAEKTARAAGATEISAHQRHGDLLEALLDCESRTLLFVIGRFGEQHEAHSSKLGAHLESIVRSIQTPILVSVDTFTAPTNYMIAYDGSPTADNAIASIADSEILRSMQGHLVMVGDDNPGHRDALKGATAKLASQGHTVESHLIQGAVVDALIDFGKTHSIGLTVMGAYGHSRVREFFVGSNTSRMISASAIPLLLLR